MRYVTDQKLAELGLDSVGAEDRNRALRDAEAIYAWLRENEWATDGDARKWGEREGIDVDRFNLAIRVLQDAGRIASLNASAPTLRDE